MRPSTFLMEDKGLERAGEGDVLQLDGDEGHHAARVQRVKFGENVDLVDGRGTRVRGTVTKEPERGCLLVRADAVMLEPHRQPRVVVVQALTKGDGAASAVQMMTEVGVDVVIPWQADHCVVQWQGERAEKQRSRWEVAARQATKQSRRAWLPVIEPVATTQRVLDRLSDQSLGIILDADAETTLGAMVAVPGARDVLEVVLIVGPEGGVSLEEHTTFAKAGVQSVRLGPDVMRSTTAGAVAVASVCASLGRW